MTINLRRLTGMGAIATAALAAVVFGCVFALTAGPRENLSSQTQALRQALGATSPLARAIVASTGWGQVTSSIAGISGGGAGTDLTSAELTNVTSQLHGDFNRGVVRLAPLGEDWAGMTSTTHAVRSTLAPVGGTEVLLEVAYRVPFTQYVKVVAGRLPGSAPSSSSGTGQGASPGYAPTLQVAVTQQTARRFGLHVGSAVQIAGPQIALSGTSASITLDVTGIVAEREPASTFWNADPTVAVPSLTTPVHGPAYWTGGVFAGAGEINDLQQDFGLDGLSMQWEFPLTFGGIEGNQAQVLNAGLNKIVSQTPHLTGALAPAAGTITMTSGLQQPLGAFIADADAVDVLLWLLYVSLAVAGLVVLLLTARMIALRRAAENTLRRQRGGSLLQVAAATVRGTAIAAVPAAVVAAAAAVTIFPGPPPSGAWWPPAAALLIALAAPAAVAAWQQRLPWRRARDRKRGADRRRRRAGGRLVIEAAAVAAAVGGIIVFRQQGTQPGSGVNPYTSAAPVLVAVPAVIVVARLYPLVIRALVRACARRKGATGFLGLARAARTALTPALPALALVLAITVAAFAGMVRDAVTRGEVNSSWQTAGADVAISVAGSAGSYNPISPAALRAVEAVPGVRHAAAVWQTTWTAPDNTQVSGITVDPASYAALVASTQTWPAVNARLLAGTGGGGAQPVIASPQAVSALGGSGPATLTTQSGEAPVQVRVAGEVSGTPALPGGAAFVIMPAAAIHGQAGPIPFNLLLLTGGSIDMRALAAVVGKMIPGGVTTTRSGVLAELTGAPLQHGTFTLFTVAIAVAAGLGLAVLLLELALGAADREVTLARLATMGLGEGQRTRLVLLEVAPAVIAAAVAAVACALVLPRVVAPSIDLSVFTGSSAGVPLAPDAVSVALPFAGLIVVACVALAIEIRSRRQRGVAATLRGGG